MVVTSARPAGQVLRGGERKKGEQSPAPARSRKSAGRYKVIKVQPQVRAPDRHLNAAPSPQQQPRQQQRQQVCQVCTLHIQLWEAEDSPLPSSYNTEGHKFFIGSGLVVAVVAATNNPPIGLLDTEREQRSLFASLVFFFFFFLVFLPAAAVVVVVVVGVDNGRDSLAAFLYYFAFPGNTLRGHCYRSIIVSLSLQALPVAGAVIESCGIVVLSSCP